MQQQQQQHLRKKRRIRDRRRQRTEVSSAPSENLKDMILNDDFCLQSFVKFLDLRSLFQFMYTCRTFRDYLYESTYIWKIVLANDHRARRYLYKTTVRKNRLLTEEQIRELLGTSYVFTRPNPHYVGAPECTLINIQGIFEQALSKYGTMREWYEKRQPSPRRGIIHVW